MTESLKVIWTKFPNGDIHYKKFKRMGALLEWVEAQDHTMTYRLEVSDD